MTAIRDSLRGKLVRHQGVSRGRHVRAISRSVITIAVLAVLAFLHWARSFLIPVMLATAACYCLSPFVELLRTRLRIPVSMAASLVLSCSIALACMGLWALQDQTLQVLKNLPQATARLAVLLNRSAHTPASAVNQVQSAANALQRAADTASRATAPGKTTSSTAVAGPPPTLPNIRGLLFDGTLSLLGGIAQASMIVALCFCMLISTGAFRESLVTIAGRNASERAQIVQILGEIDSQLRRYLLVQLASGALLSLLCWLVLRSAGLDDAVFWACAGGLLHLIPYVGPAAFLALVSVFSIAQFEAPGNMLLAAGGCLVGVVFTGLVVVPWLTQRTGHLNGVAVFLALLFWGWLWGVWGLLLGVPIMLAFSVVCAHRPALNSISAFLGPTASASREARRRTS